MWEKENKNETFLLLQNYEYSIIRPQPWQLLTPMESVQWKKLSAKMCGPTPWLKKKEEKTELFLKNQQQKDVFHWLISKPISNHNSRWHKYLLVSIVEYCIFWPPISYIVLLALTQTQRKLIQPKIDTSTMSGLHEFKKYTNNHASLTHMGTLGDLH